VGRYILPLNTDFILLYIWMDKNSINSRRERELLWYKYKKISKKKIWIIFPKTTVRKYKRNTYVIFNSDEETKTLLYSLTK